VALDRRGCGFSRRRSYRPFALLCDRAQTSGRGLQPLGRPGAGTIGGWSCHGSACDSAGIVRGRSYSKCKARGSALGPALRHRNLAREVRQGQSLLLTLDCLADSCVGEQVSHLVAPSLGPWRKDALLVCQRSQKAQKGPRSSATDRAICAALRFTSPTRSPSPCISSRGRVPPNVLVVSNRAPASAYAACALRTASRFSRFQSSPGAPSSRPLSCNSVPVPPSSRTGRCAASHAASRFTRPPH
jgi:hypothetical protein